MPPTEIDTISRRNVQLQDEAQAAKDALTAEQELHGKLQSQHGRLQADLAAMAKAKATAVREAAEAEQRLAVVKTQIGAFKDQGKKVGSLEASNKTLKKQVAALKQAAKQREGSPELQDQLASLKDDLKGQKASYEALWGKAKRIEDLYDGLRKDTAVIVKELMFWGQKESDVPSKDRARYTKFRKSCVDFVGELDQ